MFEVSFPIRWSDMDFLGHVNNATYFTFFENARIAWLDSHGFTLDKEGPVVLNASATYLNPLVYPKHISIKLNIHSIKNSSFMIDYEIYQEETLTTQGATKMVWIDYQTGQSKCVPDALRDFAANH